MYGVIQSGDHKGRTCVVKWIKLNSSSDDVEVRQETRPGVKMCIVVSFGEENMEKMSEVMSLEGGGPHSYTASTCGDTWLLYLALQPLA